MSSIEFDLMADDFVAFNMHVSANTELGRRQLRNSRIATSVLGASLTAAVLMLMGDRWTIALLGAVAAGAIIWLWAPSSIRSSMAKSLTKFSAGLGTSGAHSLATEDAGLREQGPSGSSFAEWAAIRSVDETESHVFIYIGPLQAYVVPKHRAQGDLDAFVSDVRERCC